MKRGYQIFDLIEEITLLDGTSYFEIANIFLNGIAEHAFNKGLIKNVRIVKLNIPHSKDIELYEKFVNEQEVIPDYGLTQWQIWNKEDPKIKSIYDRILKSNGVIG
ncbi:hypothetical protein [Xylocopilactobacillus apicola]|uniref:Uncharacterized protein n=1 Tax=Xylocopilactobacillus apicola TaxID=2932184 RepID=A0AAU9D4J3_9LACO|nr:hypothetical protein [Xylocopilactobacillus apicola]BDR58423.1 hypothetical protein XA3_08640 [Xylocopilactobacillus apicola]